MYKNILLTTLTILISSVNTFAADLKADLAKGLQALYDNKLSEIEVQDKIVKTLETKDKYEQLVSGFNPATVKWKPAKFGKPQEFQFPSPVQVEGSKSNTVFGFLYVPEMRGDCAQQYKFPGTLIVHHVAEDFSEERKMAEMATLAYKGVVMIIYLPEYGPRKDDADAKTSPFNGKISDFKRGIFQSLVDLRVSFEVLKRVPSVDTNQMQIGGLSLGGALTATLAGYDPVFDKYMIGLGGGDYGSIMTSYNNRKEAGGAIKWALQNVKHWTHEQVRDQLFDLDAFTWSHNLKNKDILMMAAKQDEIFNYENNVLKLKSIYESNGSRIHFKDHDGEHVPDHKELGKMKTIKIYWRILSSIYDFIGESKTAEVQSCNQQYK